MMQHELFGADEIARVASLPIDQRTWTREPVDRSGVAAYVIQIRAPGDPERRSREERHAALGVVGAAGEWKTLAKVSVEAWADRFRALLADGPRTFNGLCVLAADTTADAAPEAAEDALWALKDAGEVEHTVDAPVLWRTVAR